jgi:hypothetical protein
MNTTAIQNKSKNNILILFKAFVCALLVFQVAISSRAVSVGSAITEMGNVKQENVKTSSNMEFVLWFYGFKTRSKHNNIYRGNKYKKNKS